MSRERSVSKHDDLCAYGETVAVYKPMRYNNNRIFIRYTGPLHMQADKDRMMKQTASAVVLAAGSSSRMGFDKLGFDLGDGTVLGRSLRAFDACPRIGEFVLVTAHDTALARQ